MNSITDKQLKNYKVPLPEENLKHISELFNEMLILWKKDPHDILGFPTASWPVFNQIFGGARPGELITITGDTGSGKTTFAENWLFDTLVMKRPALLISLEMTWAYKARKFAQMIQNKPFRQIEKVDIAGLGNVLQDIPLWIYDYYGPCKEDMILKVIDYACRIHGCRFVVLDHLDYIVKTGAHWQGESYIIGNTMRKLCGKAQELQTTILLVAHPAKLSNRDPNKRREVDMDELKGSSSIKQESDAVLSLYQIPGEETEMLIRFQKIRSMDYAKNRGAFIRFTFDPKTSKFSEKSVKPEWGTP